MRPLTARLFGTTALYLAATLGTHANPLDGTVVSGDASITTPDPQTLVVTQTTNRAIINWREFNIEADETTRFVQPGSESWTLNRVTGSNDPSRILGTLEANGNVIIVNPDGIHFGAGATVDVNRLIATTADISDDNFNRGDLIFDQPGNPAASVVNEGTISIRDYGLSAFVAPAVRNSGVVTARLGTINLASGNTFTIDPYGDGLVKLAIDDEITKEVIDVATGAPVYDLVKNDGTLKANGGTVAMTAATARQAVNSVINNSGVIEANSVGMKNGMIVLRARTATTKKSGAPVQRVRLSGTIKAAYPPITRVTVPTPSPRRGGTIEITGEAIIAEGATIDASGVDGGGTILIGGDYLGGNANAETLLAYSIELENHEVPTARFVMLDDATTITADATDSGDGGKVIIWSDEATVTAAAISARGGSEAGDGGFVETSGKYLDVQKAADASAAFGQAGMWLLDPFDMVVQNVAASTNINIFPTLISGGVLVDQITPITSPSIVDTDTIEIALNTGTNVQVTNRGIAAGAEAGNITIKDDITKTAGAAAQFYVNAYNDIIIEPGVDITSSMNALDVFLVTTDGAIIGNNVGKIDTNGGLLDLEARDGITFHSSDDIPDFVRVNVSPLGASPDPLVIFDLSFDNDQIAFSHDNSLLTIGSGDWQIVDATSTGEILIEFGAHDIAFEDNAVNAITGRVWNFTFNPGHAIGALNSSALNGVPEITTPEFSLAHFNEPMPAGLTAALEVSATTVVAADAYDCGALSCIPTGPTTAGVPLQPFDQALLDPSVEVSEIDGVRNFLIATEYSQYIYPLIIAAGEYKNDVYAHSLIARLTSSYILLPPDNTIGWITDILDDFSKKNGFTLEDMYQINLERNKFQDEKISYLGMLLEPGWTKYPPEEAIFHSIGIDPSKVEKWVNVDGREYVFYNSDDMVPTLITRGINVGTYNFGKNPHSAEHVLLDILPWVLWGTGLDDNMTPEQRLQIISNSEQARYIMTVFN